MYLVQLDRLLTSCVTWGRLLHLSEAHFPPSIERKGGRDEGRELVDREKVCVMNGYMLGVGVGG